MHIQMRAPIDANLKIAIFASDLGAALGLYDKRIYWSDAYNHEHCQSTAFPDIIYVN
jgi:hypothetical protein